MPECSDYAEISGCKLRPVGDIEPPYNLAISVFKLESWNQLVVTWDGSVGDAGDVVRIKYRGSEDSLLQNTKVNRSTGVLSLIGLPYDRIVVMVRSENDEESSPFEIYSATAVYNSLDFTDPMNSMYESII
jgi:hypothetical protein